MVLMWLFGLAAAVPPLALWLTMLFQAFVYLVFTARGDDPYLLLLDVGQWGVILVAILPCFWYLACRECFQPAAVARPLLLSSLYILPFVLVLHMNFATAFVDFNVATNAQLSPGAIACVVVLVIAVVVAVVFHCFKLYKTTSFRAYVYIYIAIAVSYAILTWLFLHHATIHLHHSVLAAILLPLTRFSHPASILTQAICLGCFINGIAFWGLSPPWDASTMTGPAPTCLSTAIANNHTLSVFCNATLPPSLQFAFSVNGAVVCQGFSQHCLLDVLNGSTLAIAVSYVYPDGSMSGSGEALTISIP
jgi:hypothetical protein